MKHFDTKTDPRKRKHSRTIWNVGQPTRIDNSCFWWDSGWLEEDTHICVLFSSGHTVPFIIRVPSLISCIQIIGISLLLKTNAEKKFCLCGYFENFSNNGAKLRFNLITDKKTNGQKDKKTNRPKVKKTNDKDKDQLIGFFLIWWNILHIYVVFCLSWWDSCLLQSWNL